MRTPALVEIVVTHRVRGATRLDEVVVSGLEDPSIEAVVSELEGPGPVLLRGGEPTLRPDLPQLARAVTRCAAEPVCLRTDGLPLVSSEVCTSLVEAGVGAVRIPFPSARSEAHDWLVRQRGAARTVRRAIRVAAGAGLPVEVEITLTRPTAGHVEETVAVAAHLGAAAVRVRRLLDRGNAADDFFALSPRIALLKEPLGAATRAAAAAELPIRFEGLPACVLPTDDLLEPVPTTDGVRCVGCDASRCSGYGGDYVRRFGDSEIDLDRSAPETVTIALVGSSRQVRQRLVGAAGRGCLQLRVTDIDHPEAAELLRETLRLGFERVEVVAPLASLASLSDDQLRRIRKIALFEATDGGPETDRALRRIAEVNPRTEIRSKP